MKTNRASQVSHTQRPTTNSQTHVKAPQLAQPATAFVPVPGFHCHFVRLPTFPQILVHMVRFSRCWLVDTPNENYSQAHKHVSAVRFYTAAAVPAF